MKLSTTSRRFAAGIAGAAAIALLVAGCATSTPSASNAPTSKANPAAAACGSGEDSSSVFALGSFLPLTGSLSFLAPPAVAGVGAALSDINAAGGVNGKKACIISQDSSDGDHKATGDSNIKALIQAKPSAIVGPESSSVTHNILPVTQPTGTIVFSPAATDDGEGVKWTGYTLEGPRPHLSTVEGLADEA